MSVTTEPVVGAFGVLPIGEYKGSPAVASPGQAAVRPFGVRFAAPPQPTVACPVVDFSTWSYDAERQIAVVKENGYVIEAAKHSTGATQTPTNTGDGTRFERDDDVTED